jgi:type IV secretory pathway VirB3-like protein
VWETQQAIPLFGHFSTTRSNLCCAVAVAVVVGVVLSLFLALFALLVLLVLLVLFHLLSSLGGRKEVHYRHLLDCWEPKLVRSDVVFYWRGHPGR